MTINYVYYKSRINWHSLSRKKFNWSGDKLPHTKLKLFGMFDLRIERFLVWYGMVNLSPLHLTLCQKKRNSFYPALVI